MNSNNNKISQAFALNNFQLFRLHQIKEEEEGMYCIKYAGFCCWINRDFIIISLLMIKFEVSFAFASILFKAQQILCGKYVGKV